MVETWFARGVVGVLSLAVSGGIACAVTPFDSGPGSTEAMAAAHQHDTPAATAATVPDPSQPVATVDDARYGVQSGQPLHGYLAHPQNHDVSGLPGLIVIHEWWGLNDNVRAMTRRLAGEGYAALAVDLYGGGSATTPDEAKQKMGPVMAHPEEALANLKAAYEHLKKAGVTRIGVIGWCFGGGWSLQTALAIPDGIAAAVVYYGRPEMDKTKLDALKAPLLGLYGAEDTGIPVTAVRSFEALAKELGKNVDFHIYDGAGHAFANPSGTGYRPVAAADAWGRTIAFFARYLK
jgi:carboxymethylenebutenolidase